MSIFGAAIGGMANIGLGALNNKWSKENTREFMKLNYDYNERAAQNADTRTRAMYKDIYSPQALIQQYQKAGLSPSMMFGGTPGQGGTLGAQGAGAAGPQPTFMPLSLLEGVQAANIAAQTEKTKAETKNIEKDTEKIQLENDLKEMTNSIYATEFKLINTWWEDKDTHKPTSLFEMASEYYSYESYLEAVREGLKDNPGLNNLTQTEAGQKTLRSIYESSSRFNRDIMVLSEETISSSFQISIINCLKEHNFIELNAQAAIAQLRQEIATNELTESQKEAWNNLINKLGKKGSTGRDIAIVLGMILGNFASHTGIKVNLGKK